MSDQIRVEIHGYSAEQIESVIASEFWSETRAEGVEASIDAIVRERVTEIADAYIREKLQPRIEEVIEGGWRKTNSYGEPTGATITLASMVREQLSGSGFGNSFNDTVRKATRDAINNELAPLMEKAKQQIQTLLDKATLEKLRAALA